MYASGLQANDGGVSLAFCPQAVPQAPQYFCRNIEYWSTQWPYVSKMSTVGRLVAHPETRPPKKCIVFATVIIRCMCSLTFDAPLIHLETLLITGSFLTQGATVQLVSSLILSSLNGCNSVPAGLPPERLLCLQKIQK